MASEPKFYSGGVQDLDALDVCVRKFKYLSKAAAKARAARDSRMFGVVMFAYACRGCGGFHLSKMDPVEYRRRKRNGSL